MWFARKMPNVKKTIFLIIFNLVHSHFMAISIYECLMCICYYHVRVTNKMVIESNLYAKQYWFVLQVPMEKWHVYFGNRFYPILRHQWLLTKIHSFFAIAVVDGACVKLSVCVYLCVWFGLVWYRWHKKRHCHSEWSKSYKHNSDLALPTI